MKLLHSAASPFVRKCLVAAHELGLRERIELVPAAAHPVNRDRSVVAHNPLGKIPTLIPDEGAALYDSRVICEYLNDELGDYRLCPRSGRERWHILSVVSVATSGIMECQVMRRAEMLRKRDASQNKQEFSPSFVRKMMERMDRCYQRLDELPHDFRADVDLGRIAAAFRIPLPRG